MREILFRGKTTDRGEWVQGCYTETLRYNNFHWIWNGKNHFTVNPETVGQYTGLTDKNGKKIFEGDIVKWNINYAIVWQDCKFVLKKDINAKSYDYVLSCFDGTELEIIGNIHNNPESMEADNE